MSELTDLLFQISGNVLLFCLVFGMSATVDIGCMMQQIRNTKAILTGAFLQFIVLPLLGFLVVKGLNLDHAMGITLLVVTSSPGGSYSNWWCSMFNGDLALSVTMTAISTFLSIAMLPLNLLFYARFSFDDDVIGNLDWPALFISIGVVISAILLGLLASEKINSHNFNNNANRLGNFAGIALVVFSAYASSSDEDSALWSRDWTFYVGVSAPCVLGLLIANVVTTALQLKKPERVTVSIECCYQNTGIATSVALTMFQGGDLADALGVPLFYGLVEAVVLGIYCIIAWKCNWTKAPAKESFCTMIGTSYEIIYAEVAEKKDLEMGIEVSLASSGDEEDTPNHCYHKHEEGEVHAPHRMSFAAGMAESVFMGPVPLGPGLLSPEARFRKARGKKEMSQVSIRTSVSPEYMKSLGYEFAEFASVPE